MCEPDVGSPSITASLSLLANEQVRKRITYMMYTSTTTSK